MHDLRKKQQTIVYYIQWGFGIQTFTFYIILFVFLTNMSYFYNKNFLRFLDGEKESLMLMSLKFFVFFIFLK